MCTRMYVYIRVYRCPLWFGNILYTTRRQGYKKKNSYIGLYDVRMCCSVAGKEEDWNKFLGDLFPFSPLYSSLPLPPIRGPNTICIMSVPLCLPLRHRNRRYIILSCVLSFCVFFYYHTSFCIQLLCYFSHIVHFLTSPLVMQGRRMVFFVSREFGVELAADRLCPMLWTLTWFFFFFCIFFISCLHIHLAYNMYKYIFFV